MPDNPTVFISYSHKDEEFVGELYRRLTRDGVSCFFDRKSISWGDNWVVALEEGIDKCEILLLMLSPDFCASEWSKLERTSAIADDPAGLKRKIRPLLLEPCGDLLPRFLKPIHQIDISTPSKVEEEYPRICESLGGAVIKDFTDADRAKLPPVCLLPERHRMPYRSLGNGFVGRVSDLWQIHDILRESKTAAVEGVGAVMGTGGLGKTQLAVEYVHRFGLNYPGGVFWIDADRGISILISQVLEGAKFKIEGTLKEDEQLHELWRALSSSQHTLIVLDNFPEDETLQPWLPPQKNIYVLVTTRRRDLTCAHINLNFMTPQEGISLLDSGDRKFGQNAKALVELLGGLPLALELARNYLNIRTDLTIDRLVEEIKKTGTMKVLDAFAKNYANELPDRHTKEVAATFKMSWDIASDTAKAVLQAMSLLAPVSVSRELLKKVLALPAGDIFNDPLSDAIGELDKKLSMINLNEENEPWLHRLISGFVRTTIGEDSDLFGKAADAVVDEMGRVRDDKDSRAYYELEKITPHADVLLASEFIKAEQAVDLSDYLRWHNWKWGRYRLAERYGRQSLSIAEKSFEPGHPSIAIRQSNLATVLQDLGELQEAKDLLRKALASAEKSYKPGHPFIATRQSNLALVLKKLGELQEAKDLLRNALASAEKSFEPGHPSIAVSQSNLALVLKDLGELQEARDLVLKSYETLLNKFGLDHPYTKIAKGNLEAIESDITEGQ